MNIENFVHKGFKEFYSRKHYFLSNYCIAYKSLRINAFYSRELYSMLVRLIASEYFVILIIQMLLLGIDNGITEKM